MHRQSPLSSFWHFNRPACTGLARTMYIRCIYNIQYCWQGHHQIYGQMRWTYTVLANLKHVPITLAKDKGNPATLATDKDYSITFFNACHHTWYMLWTILTRSSVDGFHIYLSNLYVLYLLRMQAQCVTSAVCMCRHACSLHVYIKKIHDSHVLKGFD